MNTTAFGIQIKLSTSLLWRERNRQLEWQEYGQKIDVIQAKNILL